MAVHNLSIRLLREDFTIEQSIREDSGLEPVAASGVRLYVKRAHPQAPDWVDFVGSFAAEPLGDVTNKNCGAVLFLSGVAALPNGVGPANGGDSGDGNKTPKQRNFTCAVAFGSAHLGLTPDAFERSFGLRVVLNSVPRDKLRAIDTSTLDATTVQRRIQTSRTSDLQIFGMDTNRDLLRLAAGTPTDSAFATALAGKDALTVRRKLEAAQLVDCCAEAVTRYHKTDYRPAGFEFIDHVEQVRDKALIADLDDVIFDELKSLVNGGTSDLHLALPDIFDPEKSYDVSYYGSALRARPKVPYPEIRIEDYVAELQAGNFASITSFKAVKEDHDVVRIKDGEPDRKHHERVYRCFVLETELREHLYVIFAGDWFQVDKNFFKEVETDFQNLVAAPFIASTTAKNEAELIKQLESDAQLLNIDKVKASPAGASGANFEPCDFLSLGRQLIHLKDGKSSSSISHLWNQAVVSCEAFVRDGNFRKKFKAEAVKREKKFARTGFASLLPNANQRPRPNEFPVIFGIMRSPKGKTQSLDPPFFSKVSVRTIAARIDSMGFPVEVHLIEKS